MPTYKYKAATTGGDILEGEMDAANQDIVVERLHAKGQIPIRTEEIKSLSLRKRPTADTLFRASAVSPKDISNFTLELSALLDAGIPLEGALAILSQLGESNSTRILVEQLHEDIRKGAAFSEALGHQRSIFSSFYINLVRAGETGGVLNVAVRQLSDFLERSKALKEAVTAALVYPLILLIVSVASIAMIITVVVPRFAVMFEEAGARLPWQTQLIMDLGHFSQSNWWLLLIVLVSAYFGAKLLLKNPTIRRDWDRLLTVLPLVGPLIIRLETARYTRTLAVLLSSGVPMVEALDVAGETVGNSSYRHHLSSVVEGIRDGRPIARCLTETQVIPMLACHLVKVGEETGQLETMLEKVADIYDAEVKSTLHRLVSILEPALILILAVVIAAIIFSILIAVFSINDLAL